MGKWADFGISRASYSNGLVERVEVRADPGGRMGDLETWTREQVVAALVLGAKVATMKEASAGGWVKMEEVRLVSIGDDLFVRVGDGEVVEDSLGEIDA